MSRKMQIGALALLFTLALFAKSVGNLFEAQMSSSPFTFTAHVQFHGAISQVIENQGQIVVTGNVDLSGMSDPNVAHLLGGNRWNALATLSFKRNPNGTITINQQGHIHIRATPAGFTPMLIEGNVSRIIAILIGLESGKPVDFDGEIQAYSDTIANDLETEIALTDPWGPGQFGLTSTILEATNIAIDTQWPMTNTPNGVPTAIFTSPPTFVNSVG